MKFGTFSKNWYTVSLDTEKQIFIASLKNNPAISGSGVTIETAVSNLSSEMKYVQSGQLV